MKKIMQLSKCIFNIPFIYKFIDTCMNVGNNQSADKTMQDSE